MWTPNRTRLQPTDLSSGTSVLPGVSSPMMISYWIFLLADWATWYNKKVHWMSLSSSLGEQVSNPHLVQWENHRIWSTVNETHFITTYTELLLSSLQYSSTKHCIDEIHRNFNFLVQPVRVSVFPLWDEDIMTAMWNNMKLWRAQRHVCILKATKHYCDYLNVSHFCTFQQTCDNILQ